MILVARTENQLPDTVAFFNQAGITVSPFAISVTHPLPITIPDEAVGVVFTSITAVACTPRTDLPAYCVGRTTARAALRAGFKVVLSGDGGAKELADLILERCMPCTLFHPVAANADLSWHETMAKQRFDILTTPAYKTTFADALPSLKDVKTVLLFSSAGAKHFCKLAEEQNIDLSGIHAMCLSDNVAQKTKGFGHLSIATQPTLEDLAHDLKASLKQKT